MPIDKPRELACRRARHGVRDRHRLVSRECHGIGRARIADAEAGNALQKIAERAMLRPKELRMVVMQAGADAAAIFETIEERASTLSLGFVFVTRPDMLEHTDRVLRV